MNLLLLVACGPEHPDYTASPCLAAQDPRFDRSAMLGAWSTPPCDGLTDAGCRVQSISVDGEQRCFSYPVPATGTEGKALVVFWHGSDSNGWSAHLSMNEQFDDLRLEAALGDDAVIIYPDGRTHTDCAGTTCWDRDPDGPDVAFFDALVDELAVDWGIDRDTVYSVGHSRGARFTEVLGCHRGDGLAGIAIMSAGDDNVDACPQRAPVWLSHSENDRTIAFSDGLGHLEDWARRNACDAPAESHPWDQCTRLTGCDVPVEWCPTTVEEWEGHAPPPLADEELWAFFQDVR